MKLQATQNITKTVARTLTERASSVAGRRKVRTLGQGDVTLFVELLRKHRNTAKSIRVYSRDGFVSNSYKYRAEIDYIHGDKGENGEWVVQICSGDAKRSGGSGPLATVDRKAA